MMIPVIFMSVYFIIRAYWEEEETTTVKDLAGSSLNAEKVMVCTLTLLLSTFQWVHTVLLDVFWYLADSGAAHGD